MRKNGLQFRFWAMTCGVAACVATTAWSADSRMFPDLVLRYKVGDPGATNPISFTEGPKTLIAADLNIDGRADIISGNLDGSISVLLGQSLTGPGASAATLSTQILHRAEGVLAGSSLRALAAADFNLDGKIDIAAADIAGGAVVTMLGRGTGELEPFGRTTVGPARALAAADFNGDAKPDLLVACSPPDCEGCVSPWVPERTNRFVAVLIGVGDGTFQPPKYLFGPEDRSCFYEVAAGDMNLDGYLDALALDFTYCRTSESYKQKRILIMLGGPGGFTTNQLPYILPVAGEGPRSFTLAYLDERMTNGVTPPNATLDIIVANRDSSTLDIYLNHGAMDFGDPMTISPGDAPRDVGVGDLDGDGLADLVVVNRLANTISLLRSLGQGRFSTPEVELATGVSPRLIALADINGDGVLDAAVNNRVSEDISVFTGIHGMLGFLISQNYYPAGITPVSVVAEDFNKDGFPDVATASLRSHEIQVRLNNQAGGFGPATNIPVNFGPAFLASEDLNGDTYSDLIVTCLGASLEGGGGTSGSLVTLMGSANGQFTNMVTTPWNLPAFKPYWLRLGDLSGDGFLDAAVGGIDGALVLFQGSGQGIFTNVVKLLPGDGRPLGFDLGDFNGDSRLDIATSRGKVLLNDGAFFSTNVWMGGVKLFNAGFQAWAVETADLDEDGKLDLMVALTFQRPDPIGVFFGKGDGSFEDPTIYEGPDVGVVAISPTDMDGDGKKDIVIANRCAATVIILRSLGNRLFTYGEIVQTYSVEDLAVADFNKDGRPDLAGVGTGLWLVFNGGTNTFVAPTGTIADTQPTRPGLFINEIMASNQRFRFVSNSTPDWVEIYNNSPFPIHLGGWSLVRTTSEGISTRWNFPTTNAIAEQGHLVVYFSTAPLPVPFAAPFELSAEGETLSLFNGAGWLVDVVHFPAMPEDVSYARFTDGARFFSYNPAPTFESANLRPGNLSPSIERKDPFVGSGARSLGLTGRVFDDVAVAYAAVCYRVAGEQRFEEIPLNDDGQHGDKLPGDGYFGALLPAIPEGQTVEYYLLAVDLEGQLDFSPDEYADSSRLYRVRAPEPFPIRFSELVAANSTILTDERNQFEDWIELVNTGSATISLNGYGLTKNYFERTNVWRFPASTSLAPGKSLIVFCDEDPADGPLHANFKLLRDGDRVFLMRLEPWTVVDSLSYGPLPADTSFGLFNWEGEPQLLAWPTPREANIPLPMGLNLANPELRVFARNYPIPGTQNSYMALRWLAPGTPAFQVQWSEDLKNWTPSPVAPSNLGEGLYQWRDAASAGMNRFYRILRTR